MNHNGAWMPFGANPNQFQRLVPAGFPVARPPPAPRAAPAREADFPNVGNLSLQDRREVPRVPRPIYWSEVPWDLMIIYDKGQLGLKVHRALACSKSAWFREALEGVFSTSDGWTIRLRSDFPYAILAMVEFWYHGSYFPFSTIFRDLNAEFPNTTEMDYHVLIYTAGSKYDVPGLRARAIGQYESIVRNLLRRDFSVIYYLQDRNRHYSRQHHQNSDMTPYEHPDYSTQAEFYRFINSLTLIWANTTNARDEMRQAALEMIKIHLNKLCRCDDFNMIVMHLRGFGRDLIQSIEQDGFEVGVQRAETSRGMSVAFNTLPTVDPRQTGY